MMPRRRVLRLGLVGAGRWGLTLARVISSLPDLTLVAVCARNSGAGTLFPDARMVRNWELLFELELDGVIVATPPCQHAGPALGAIERGLPVLIEKPMTSSLESACSLVEAARDHEAVVMVDHTQLYAPGIVALRARLRDLGSAAKLVMHAGGWGPFRKGQSVLWDWGSHEIALALDLSESSTLIVESVACGSWETAKGDCAETAELSLRSPVNGCDVRIRVSNGMPGKERTLEAVVAGTKLTYKEYPRPRVYEVTSESGQVEHSFHRRGPVDCVLEEFGRRIRMSDRSADSVLLGAQVVRVLTLADAFAAD